MTMLSGQNQQILKDAGGEYEEYSTAFIYDNYEKIAMAIENGISVMTATTSKFIENLLLGILYSRELSIPEYQTLQSAVKLVELKTEVELLEDNYEKNKYPSEFHKAFPFAMYRYAKEAVDKGNATDEEFEFARGIPFSQPPNEKIKDVLSRLSHQAMIDAISTNPSMIQLYSEPCEEMQLAAVKASPESIKYITNPCGDALLIANGLM